jgi:hypothetical protein
MKKSVVLFLGVFVSLLNLSVQAGLPNVVYWNFSQGGASPSSNSFSGLSVFDLSQGNSHGAVGLLTPTSASSGYTNTGGFTAAGFSTSGSTNAGISAWTGALDTSGFTNSYFQTGLTLDSAATLSYSVTDVSLGSRSTSTGPQLLSLYSSTDGINYSFLSGISTSANSAWLTIDFGALSLNLNPGDSLYFRIYGSAGTGNAAISTANWRIDDLGITLSPSPAPEPTTLALATFGGLGCFIAFRRRN